MEIILHRANSVGSWFKSELAGWGIEVDVRTHCEKLYIAHDPIQKLEDWMPSFASLMEFHNEAKETTIILDFKESGLIRFVPTGVYHAKLLCTDLIVPDQIRAKEHGVRTLTRRSVYENIDVGPYRPHNKSWWISDASMYWIDYVFDTNSLNAHEEIANQSYVVSPELHGRDLTLEFIKAVYAMGFLGVCTDYPERYAEHA